MGLDVVYTSPAGQHVVRFTDAEWTSLRALGEVAPSAAEVLFDFLDFGEAVLVNSLAMVAATDELLRLMRDRPELLPAAYQFRMENWMGTGMPGDWSGGAAHGIRLPGDPDHVYALDTRGGACLLQKVSLKDHQLVSREAIGHLKALETETCGRIDIRRRSSGTGLAKKLQAMRDFATSGALQLTKQLG